MDNKQQIQANNAELEKHKQDILSLPMADDVKNGKYVWKKYEYTPAETIQVINPKSTLTYYKSDSFKVSSDDYNVNSVDISFFNGFTLAVAKYDQYIINDGYVTINGSNIEVVYDKTNAILTVKGVTYSSSDSGTLNYNGVKTYEKEEKIGGLIGYTVSDSETAYPDGGEKDGFWWEKVEKGVTGIDFGTVTFASTTTDPIIPHSLKKTPTAFCIVPKGEMGEGSFNEITNFLFYSVKPIKSSYGLYGIWVTHYKNELNNEAVYETFSHAPTLSSTKISLKGKFLNSYYWFAIA